MMLYLEPLDGGMVHALEISPQRAGEDVVHTGADRLDSSLRALTASWRHLAHDQHRRLSEAPAPSPDEKRHDYYPYILYYLIIIHQEHCVTNAALCWQTSSTTAFLNLYVIPHISNRKRSKLTAFALREQFTGNLFKKSSWMWEGVSFHSFFCWNKCEHFWVTVCERWQWCLWHFM